MSRKVFTSGEGSDAENLPSTSRGSERISSLPMQSVNDERDSESDVYDSDVDPPYLHHSDADSDSSSSSDDGDIRKRKTLIKKRKNNGSEERSMVVGEEGMPIGRNNEDGGMREGEEGGVSEAAAVPGGEEGGSGNGADISDGGDATEPDPEQRPRGRKAKKLVEQWARNVAKKKRNLGQEYVSEKNKKICRGAQGRAPV